ncbi:PAS domain S-box protein [bacterium AH-315-M05]|nr:PAS domain S-box protein [bacterium AH-315-M05]
MVSKIADMSAPIKSSKKTKDRNQRQSVLERRIKELEKENKLLKEKVFGTVRGDTVSVPEELKPVFDIAQKTVGDYFKKLKTDPTHGTIDIDDQRYVLVRASALSYDFLTTIKNLYADRGEKNAFLIGKNFLFDIAHTIGMNDARNFHSKMGLTDPISKLSAGPVHFAYSGWAFVDILPESAPSPDENYFLTYHHPFSFEADSWIKAGKKSDFPVCIMNAGYSSGWCEESFDIPLTAVEITCKAKGDDNCTFIMAPPAKIEEHIKKYLKKIPLGVRRKIVYDIPTFFERKKVEEALRVSEEKYRNLIETMHEGLLQVDNEDKIVFVNRRFCEMIGSPQDELIGKYAYKQLLPQYGKTRKEIKKIIALRKKGISSQYEAQVSTKSGELKWFIIDGSPVYDTNGKVVGSIGVHTDITERKKAEEQLHKSLQEKEILLREIHHRVKNNLQIISSMLSLQSSYISDKGTINILKESQDRIKSMAFIHESLYQTKDFSSINISEYIENLSKNLVYSFGTQYNFVSLKLDTDKIYLNLDTAIPCGLIINELVSNSLKYAFPDNHKGEIKITLKQKNTRLILTVADNGIGFPSGLNFKKTKSLGLQLVNTLVDQVNGNIKITNKKGTKFIITLAAKNKTIE